MCFRQFAEPDFYLIFLQNYLSNNEFSSFFPPDYLIISGINQVIRLKVAYVFTCYLGCFVFYQVKIRLLLLPPRGFLSGWEVKPTWGGIVWKKKCTNFVQTKIMNRK